MSQSSLYGITVLENDATSRVIGVDKILFAALTWKVRLVRKERHELITFCVTFCRILPLYSGCSDEADDAALTLPTGSGTTTQKGRGKPKVLISFS